MRSVLLAASLHVQYEMRAHAHDSAARALTARLYAERALLGYDGIGANEGEGAVRVGVGDSATMLVNVAVGVADGGSGAVSRSQI